MQTQWLCSDKLLYCSVQSMYSVHIMQHLPEWAAHKRAYCAGCCVYCGYHEFNLTFQLTFQYQCEIWNGTNTRHDIQRTVKCVDAFTQNVIKNANEASVCDFILNTLLHESVWIVCRKSRQHRPLWKTLFQFDLFGVGVEVWALVHIDDAYGHGGSWLACAMDPAHQRHLIISHDSQHVWSIHLKVNWLYVRTHKTQTNTIKLMLLQKNPSIQWMNLVAI